MSPIIEQATESDLAAISGMAALLWPEAELGELECEFEDLLIDDECALFVAIEDGETKQPVGFAQCQLRHDYVEGTSTSPVGYLEGIYVRDEHRLQGVAQALLVACEGWAAEQGCTEFASDCELSNADSIAFHLASGFAEANRIVCFTKRLD